MSKNNLPAPERILIIDQATMLSGDRAKLKDLLFNRLSECGWSDEVRLICRDIYREKGNQQKADELMAAIIPIARSLVPDAVKMELLLKIKSIVAAQMNVEI